MLHQDVVFQVREVVIQVTASYAFGQSVILFISELKQFYTVRKGDLSGPPIQSEDYDFKPTPDMRTFGQLIAHIADAQMSFCSGAKGQPRRLNAASKTSKVYLIGCAESVLR